MDKIIIDKENDPMGHAIADFSKGIKGEPIRVFSSEFEEDEIPTEHLFRDYNEMPVIEQKAIDLSKGKILDVGAGSGCHSIALQHQGKKVKAIDISTLSIETIKGRGVEDAEVINFFDKDFNEKFDTILMLMNGSGIIGKIERIPQFFKRLDQLLAPNGQVLIDSSDLKYLYEDEDGSFLINITDNYYGEIDFQMKYKNITGDKFDWLYIDFETLSFYAKQFGYKAQLIAEGEHFDYLAKLKKNI